MFGFVELTSPSTLQESDPPETRRWFLLGDEALRLDDSQYQQQRSRVRLKHLCDEHNRARLDFLRTEIALALTFAQIALHAQLETKNRVRASGHARKAYETVTRLSRKTISNPQEANALLSELGKLKDELAQLARAY